jgi:23S rRNA pseudouridine2605 synthase
LKNWNQQRKIASPGIPDNYSPTQYKSSRPAGLFYFCGMKKKTGFEKFMSKEKTGAAKKEYFRQEKKKITKERKEYFEKQRAEAALNRGMAKGPQKSAITRTVEEKMPLNKYIAHCGVCSRRDAVDIIKSGKVKVNSEVITEPGYKISTGDTVIVSGKKITPVKNLVYILMNKPKDYITTTEDERGRKTVLDLIKKATTEKVYPVGRLDRNTSGVLLLTNDGDLTQKLTHPSNEIKKVYAVTLDKPLAKNHFDEILKGVPLEDGVANVDSLAYTDVKDKTQIGVEIHSGRNRIVRRIFEHYGYDVKNLDRVIFAGLTKKNVERGKWRFLSEKEVRDLKYFKKGRS